MDRYGMIPKLFHHTWPSGGTLNNRFISYRAKFMDLHPGYKFMLWTCEDRKRYCLSEESSFLQSPESPMHWIVKSDIMRWEILYQYGGIYLDTDVECLKNFEGLLNCKSFAGYSYPDGLVGNALVGTVPGNPLFKAIALAVVENIIKNGPAESNGAPHEVCGPSFVTKYLARVEKIYPREYFYPIYWEDTKEPVNSVTTFNSYSIHWWSGMDEGGWLSQVSPI
jgi:mannosyltransferase OCH1-like enzyme